MGKIKSAIEIALEKTQDVEVDRESLEVSRYNVEGKRAVSKFFADPEIELKKLIKDYSGKQLTWVKEGIFQALMANLKLPVDEMALKQGRRTREGFYAIIRDAKRLGKLMTQMEHFLEEFLEERKRLVEAVEKQYAPILKQKEEQMSRQMGNPVRIDPASDPEFQKLIRQNLTLLEDRYGQVLDQVRGELEKMTG